MKSLFRIITLIAVSLVAVSCFQEKGRNYQYFPNMYKSASYETYLEYDGDLFENGQEAKLPVEGTVSRGWMPYEYEDSNEGYQNAKANLSNPLPYTEDNVNEGKALYTIYCAICHGDKGDGKGTLAQREKILGIPAYNDAGRAITEGSIYHVMFYGLNNMGSYAVQTNEFERWQIAHYVLDLKRNLNGEPQREFEDAEIENASSMKKGIALRDAQVEHSNEKDSLAKGQDENSASATDDHEASEMSNHETSENN
ncbi:c-type cytochrome [Mesonia aestuariivivens]|uniref:Cytochrome c n=1 Tax=Mesonia aestuariivivens TaxID=2796128 RepID=A0ABS6W3L8_9FLAO|nr:cytochrome c [Mesonia aestuariivivens]MBW2962455.1 cytochrome c [Mesonia aestuariivivens]